jgi:hypothetical protein
VRVASTGVPASSASNSTRPSGSLREVRYTPEQIAADPTAVTVEVRAPR